MVVLEGLSFGLPVVVSSSRYCGISADLVHGSDALILRDPRSETELAAAISALLQNVDLREKLTRNALVFAGKNTWASVAKSYEDLFLDLVTGANSTASK